MKTSSIVSHRPPHFRSNRDFLGDHESDSAIQGDPFMESHVIYFAAGDTRIKDLMIKKDPTFSV